MTLNFDWKQTPTSITITFNSMVRVDAKKIDYVITENYLKLNITEIKLFKFFDLYSEIDWEKSECILQDFQIIFYLKKLVESTWPELEFKAKKDELKIRREQALSKYELKKKELDEMSKTRKKEFEKFVLDKSIKMEEDKRHELKNKKNQEKTDAINDVYNFFENQQQQSTTNTATTTTKKVKELESSITKESKEKESLQNLNNNAKNVINEPEKKGKEVDKSLLEVKEANKNNLLIVNNKLRKDENSIFSEEDLFPNENNFVDTKEEIKVNTKMNTKMDTKIDPIDDNKRDKYNSRLDNNIVRVNNFREVKEPSKEALLEVRKSTNIRVNLTEKAVPHFATRESLAKEPPYPKGKKFEPVKNYVYLLNKNYLAWN